MNAAQEELLDRALLLVLDANRTRIGLGVEGLAHLIGQFGFPNTSHETVLDRIDYLTRHGRVEEVCKQVNRANRAWRITEAGIQHLDR